ncbi:MAG: RNA 2',3'-cyclic phosphodiesterase [Candidatus Krumholzibacteria bacterium]|nr:RNA 2',3'-cyclic phosphodiesterase [Candidatus Krumholzibacteria bacterium]
MRLFYAVKVSDAIKTDIEAAIRAFPLRNPPWRWISTGNMHLTLKFLGEVDEGVVPDLKAVAANAASRVKPFRVAYGPFGGFPNLARPRVIFFQAMEGARELAEIARHLEAGVEPLGIPRENRPFAAHLTLARIKEPLPHGTVERLTSVPPLPPTAFQDVDRFVLMRSHLAREGATYEEIGSFPLASNAS